LPRADWVAGDVVYRGSEGWDHGEVVNPQGRTLDIQLASDTWDWGLLEVPVVDR
jgi:hypothetical protein